MKNFILIAFLITLAATLYAAPGDIEITIVIPAAKVQEFRTAFLADKPMQQVENPAYLVDPNEPTTIDAYTERDWFKKVMRDYLLRIYCKGKKKLAIMAAIIDNDVVQE